MLACPVRYTTSLVSCRQCYYPSLLPIGLLPIYILLTSQPPFLVPFITNLQYFSHQCKLNLVMNT